MVLLVMTSNGNPFGGNCLRIGLLNDKMDLIEGVLHAPKNNEERGSFIVRRSQDNGPTIVELCSRLAHNKDVYCDRFNDLRNTLGLYSNLFSNSK
jgi:hypothetical protein